MKKKVTRPVATPTSKLSKGDHSRERLVDAAIKIFAREGLGNASFQQIADAAGLKQSSLFYYFANKDELVNGVIQTVIRRSQTFVDSRISIRDDAFKKLHKYFQFMMAWANEYPHEGEVLFLLYYYAAMQKPFSVFYSQVVTTARNRILEMLDRKSVV